MIRQSQRPLPDNTQHSQKTEIHPPSGIRTRTPSKRAAIHPRLLGYGYIGARTNTTQQTNICLGIHCRNVGLYLNRQPFCTLQRHSNPIRTAASIWPNCRLQTNSLCWRQTVGEITFQSYRFQCSC
jgi:hypothetical protein